MGLTDRYTDVEIVTYDVEHRLSAGACIVGQCVVCRTTQWLVTVCRSHVANVQVAVRHDAEAVVLTTHNVSLIMTFDNVQYDISSTTNRN